MVSRGNENAGQTRQKATGDESKGAKATIDAALASIDKQAPGLTYLGFGCWNAWNTIAFSGAFWLHETDNSSVSITLMLTHLAACVVTLLAFAILSKRIPLAFAKNRVTFGGAVIAAIGTAIICFARSAIMPFDHLSLIFKAGCVLSGFGTTVVFVRGVALFGTLPPHRALYRLSEAVLFSLVIFFVLAACPNELATALFIALPLIAAALFSVRSRNVMGEKQVLTQTAPLSRQFVALLASLVLCSMAFEFLRSYILAAIPPAFSVDSVTWAQIIDIPILLCILAAILLAKSQRDNFARIYSIATSALVLLLVVMAMFSWHSIIISSLATVACSCFNLVVWAMLFYLVFQARANAIMVVGLGNAALSLGSLLSNLLTVGYLNSGITDDAMRIILAALGIAVLFDVLFVFSEKQIDAMLLPVDESVAEDGVQSQKKPGKWKLACEQLAQECGLSERETEVFMQLARGRTAQEIADREVISIYTVRAHTRSIYAKLDVHSKKELSDRIDETAKKA